MILGLSACVSPPRAPAPATHSDWVRVVGLRGEGTVSAGGLEGRFESLEDVRNGRSINRYRLGPIEGAEGYDGERAWQRTGEESIVEDAPEAVARARSNAWLTRRGWLQATGATYGSKIRRVEEGHEFDIVEARPEGGSPIELWFDPRTSRLVRTVAQVGQDRMVTRYEDFRDVAGVELPFRVISEGNDPRNRTVAQYVKLEGVDAIPDDAFARADTAPEDFHFLDGAESATLRFDLINNHIFVDATIDGHAVRLLFDTGGLNLLTPSAVVRLGLTSEGRLAARGVGKEQVDVGLAKAGTLRLGRLQMDAPLFYVMDLGDLPAVEGIEFDGLVGYEIFHRLAVRIDYAGRTIRLMPFEHYRAPAHATEVPFVLHGRIPVVEGEIDGIPAKLSIDTGSRSSLTLHAPFVREHDLIKRHGARFETVNGWGVGGPSRTWPVRLRHVRIGAAEIIDLAADLSTSATGSFANPDLSANAGSGLLRRFVVDFDYRSRRMHLTPGPDHGYRENYDRAGMWLMRDGETLRIAAIAPGGPAEHAGLVPEDRLLAIDGESVAARALADWRTFLRDTPAGTRLPIRYRRQGETRSAELTLADLIPPPR
jgi:predicted aspartyl protease